MGQESVRYVVTKDPDDIDKWGRIVEEPKEEEPPYEESYELKLLNVIKVKRVPMDDMSLAVYVRESKDSKNCYYFRNPEPHNIQEHKVLYIYLQNWQAMSLKPMFVDKFAVNYEHMEDRVTQDLTWHGLSTPEIAPKAAASHGPETSYRPREKVSKTT